MAQQQNIKRS